MYNNEKLEDMIDVLEKHKYAYTKYEHKNGYCSVNTDLLLKQLKLNEQEIRAKAVEEFVEKLKKYTYGRTSGVYVELPLYELDEIAKELTNTRTPIEERERD